MANEVRFTIKLNVDGQTKVVDATAAVDELADGLYQTISNGVPKAGWVEITVYDGLFGYVAPPYNEVDTAIKPGVTGWSSNGNVETRYKAIGEEVHVPTRDESATSVTYAAYSVFENLYETSRFLLKNQ